MQINRYFFLFLTVFWQIVQIRIKSKNKQTKKDIL